MLTRSRNSDKALSHNIDKALIKHNYLLQTGEVYMLRDLQTIGGKNMLKTIYDSSILKHLGTESKTMEAGRNYSINTLKVLSSDT